MASDVERRLVAAKDAGADEALAIWFRRHSAFPPYVIDALLELPTERWRGVVLTTMDNRLGYEQLLRKQAQEEDRERRWAESMSDDFE